MTEQEKFKKIAEMCREILDGEEPFYWNYNLSDRQKDYTIDFLLRAVLGYAERENGHFVVDGGLSYIQEKFYSAYNKITGNEIYP